MIITALAAAHLPMNAGPAAVLHHYTRDFVHPFSFPFLRIYIKKNSFTCGGSACSLAEAWGRIRQQEGAVQW